MKPGLRGRDAACSSQQETEVLPSEPDARATSDLFQKKKGLAVKSREKKDILCATSGFSWMRKAKFGVFCVFHETCLHLKTQYKHSHFKG